MKEGLVKRNKSKVEPVSKWRCPRQAGSIKLHQRAVWSLTFLVYGVYLVKTEVREDHVTEAHPDRQDCFLGMRKGMKMWEDWCLKQKKERKTDREGTQTHWKETARVGTQDPW